MRKVLFATVITLAMACAAHGEVKPQPTAQDSRIRTFDYAAHEVYKLDVYMRFITSVQFASGEDIESVQVGDSASWQIVRLKRGDVLSVKPLIEDAYTNMTVYTNRRVYTFELHARRARLGDPKLSYRIHFRYPEEIAEKKRKEAEEHARARDYRYYFSGSAGLVPIEMYDDGTKTVFRFADDAPRPAVFSVGPRGKESIVNVTQADDGFSVPTVSKRWTLRLGDETVSIAHATVVRRRGLKLFSREVAY